MPTPTPVGKSSLLKRVASRLHKGQMHQPEDEGVPPSGTEFNKESTPEEKARLEDNTPSNPKHIRFLTNEGFEDTVGDLIGEQSEGQEQANGPIYALYDDDHFGIYVANQPFTLAEAKATQEDPDEDEDNESSE